MLDGIPGPIGVAAFLAIKFGGYYLAGTILRRFVPAIRSSALNIALARTGLGVVLGPPVTLTWLWMIDQAMWSGSWLDSGYVFYVGLGLVRVLVWALILFFVADRKQYPASRLWFHAFLCALWSCLLDLPGYALAAIAPGKFSIC